MKDEIKEILDRWKKVCNNELEYVELTLEQMKLLLNYITNLQEENNHLDKVNCHLRKKINNDIYKSRIEKAIEYIKNINKRAYKDDYGTCFSTYDLLTILKGVGKE